MKKISVLMVALLLVAPTDALARRRRGRRVRPGTDPTAQTTTTINNTTINNTTTTTTTPPTPDPNVPTTTMSASASGTDPASVDPDAIKARELFETGVAAYQDGRYADAIGKFEESYRLRKTASVTLNLGITLRAMGRLVEARDRFREFFELASQRMRDQYESEVRGYLNEIARRVGTVHVNALEPASASISIDDRRVVPDTNGNIDVDPGTHRVFVEAPEFVPKRETIQVAEHAQVPLDVKLDRITANAIVKPPPPPVTSQWWFWAGIGLLAVGAGVGIAVGVSSIPLDPPGSTTGVTVDLRTH